MMESRGAFSVFGSATVTQKTILNIFTSTVARGVLLFATAGTFVYWQAWVHLAISALLLSLIALFLWRTDRNLLARRLVAGPGAEKQNDQKIIQRFTAIALVIQFTTSGLDHRFGCSAVSIWIFVLGNILIILGSIVITLVLRANTFASSTIEIFENQRVIATGPYSLIRHPMYFGILLITFGTPLALGSFYGLLPSFGIALLVTARLLSEERLLSKSLPGYVAYRRQVRFRLAPYVW